MLHIPNYVLAARRDRVAENFGGGVAIYVRNDINYSGVLTKTVNIDVQIAAIKVKDVYFVNIYRRPHLDKNIDKQTIAYLRRNFSRHKVFISGDLNLRGIEWNSECVAISNDNPSREDARDLAWLDFLIELQLEQHIFESTHKDGSQLDAVITSMDYDILSKLPKVDRSLFGSFSDHFAIISDVNIVIDQESKIRKIFDMRKMPWDKFREKLRDYDLCRKIAEAENANEMWEIIRDAMIEIRFEICPIKWVGFSAKSPWINSKLRSFIRKERKLRRKFCSSKNAKIRTLNRARWAKHRLLMKTEINRARYFYELKVIEDLRSDANAVHKHLKNLRRSNETPPITDENGLSLANDIQKCDRFQEHFLKVYNKCDDINIDWDTGGNFADFTISVERIKKVVGKMRSGTAAGIDTLNSTFYKESISELAEPLLMLFERVVYQDEFPVDWMISKVSPLYKGSGIKSDVKRWRPLSLGIIALRILERLFEKDFRPYLEDRDLIPSFQHGFRSRRSTVTNLLSSWNTLSNKIDKCESTNVLNLDGSQAFDVLLIPEILAKIKSLGVSGYAGKFLQTWLTQRFQFVQLGTSTSYMARVTSGVPQGSVLGPVIYILAASPGLAEVVSEVNDRSVALGHRNRVTILTYADDVKLNFRLASEADLEVVQILLELLGDYSKSTGLKFNGEKSQLLRLGQDQLECDLFLLGSKIPEVQNMKDLGCYFSQIYNFNVMMNTQFAKAKSAIYMVKYGLLTRNSQALTQIYQSYFQSRLLYSSEVWLNLDGATINKLERMDERFWALRPNGMVIPDCLTSVQMAVKKNLLMYFKIRHKLAIVSFDNKFEFVRDTIHTRNSEKRNLRPPKCRLVLKQREFVNITTKLYNLMDVSRRESRLYSVFAREAERIARLHY